VHNCDAEVELDVTMCPLLMLVDSGFSSADTCWAGH